MGANLSMQKNKLLKEIDTKVKSTCTNSSTVTQEIVGSNIHTIGCSGNLTLSNTASTTGECTIDSAIDTIAEASQGLTAEQKSGLPIPTINASSSSNEVKSAIRQYITNKCSNSNDVKQTIKDNTLVIDCTKGGDKNLNIFNDANMSSRCLMTLVNNTLDSIDQTSSVSQTGFELPGLAILIPIICCCICLVSAVVCMAHLHYVLIGFGILFIILGILTLTGITPLHDEDDEATEEEKEEQREIAGWTQIGVGVLLLLAGIIWYFKFGKAAGSITSHMNQMRTQANQFSTNAQHSMNKMQNTLFNPAGNIPTPAPKPVILPPRNNQSGGNKKVRKNVKKSIHKRKGKKRYKK